MSGSLEFWRVPALVEGLSNCGGMPCISAGNGRRARSAPTVYRVPVLAKTGCPAASAGGPNSTASMLCRWGVLGSRHWAMQASRMLPRGYVGDFDHRRVPFGFCIAGWAKFSSRPSDGGCLLVGRELPRFIGANCIYHRLLSMGDCSAVGRMDLTSGGGVHFHSRW